MYYPDFIKKGKVYAAVPPLFGLRKGNKTVKYFTNNAEVAKFIQNQFGKIHDIQDKDTKKKLTSNELIRLFALNIDYVDMMNHAASVCGVHPKLLEDILIQIGSAKAALHKTGQIVLQGHMHHCVLDGIESGHKDETMDRLFSAIEQFSRMV